MKNSEILDGLAEVLRADATSDPVAALIDDAEVRAWFSGARQGRQRDISLFALWIRVREALRAGSVATMLQEMARPDEMGGSAASRAAALQAYVQLLPPEESASLGIDPPGGYA
ncbi:MAG: hypothetical protein ACYDDF_08920 [Thermoplasmatota archaeon]